jgi:hypothetical protein|tara:strand:- start:496 stop:684 length:189 start_codon:yes stop_codon:yes gene_type:complete
MEKGNTFVMMEKMEAVSIIIVNINKRRDTMPGHYGKKMKKPMNKKGKMDKKKKSMKMKMSKR